MGLLSLLPGTEGASIEWYYCWASVLECLEGPGTFCSGITETQGDEGTDCLLHGPRSWGCPVARESGPASSLPVLVRSWFSLISLVSSVFVLYFVPCYGVHPCCCTHSCCWIDFFWMEITTVYVNVHFIVDGHLVISGLGLLKRVASNVVNVFWSASVFSAVRYELRSRPATPSMHLLLVFHKLPAVLQSGFINLQQYQFLHISPNTDVIFFILDILARIIV